MAADRGLENLPDELMLEIISYFNPIPSFEPQPVAFRHRTKECARQRENRERQLVLHALCLTSRHIRALATPTLYSSLLSCTTLASFRPLQLFYQTIRRPHPVPGLKIRLYDCLHYVENRSADYLGNSLGSDVQQEEGLLMVTQYYPLLAEIIKCAPNLQQLNISSLEMDDISFWRHILPCDSRGAPKAFAIHGTRKLKSVAFSMQTIDVYEEWNTQIFRRICLAMSFIPTLTDFRASGITTSGSLSLPRLGDFHNTERVEITECLLDVREVAELWMACKYLHHITCHWAYHPFDHGSPSDLYLALLRHSKTLQTLHLDPRAICTPLAVSTLGSLRPFTSLTTLSLSVAALGIEDQFFDHEEQKSGCRLSSVLPQSLEMFDILITRGYEPASHVRLDRIRALWDLASDAPHSLPKLRIVRALQLCRLYAPKLTNAFKNVGVYFDTVKEALLDPKPSASQGRY